MALLAALFAQATAWDDLHGWGDDFIVYAEQALCLRHGGIGDLIARNRYTVEHSSVPFGPHAYPWGYPLLLAPVAALWGLRIDLLKIPGILCYLALFPVLWYGLADRLDRGGRTAILALLALNPYFIKTCQSLQSDIPFLFLSTLGILAIDRLRGWERPTASPASLFGLGLVLAGAFLVRTNGILLLGALAALDGLLLLRGGWSCLRRPSWYLPYLGFGFLAGPILWLLPGGSGSHFDHFTLFEPWVIRYNLSYYARVMADFFFGLPHPFVFYVVSLPLALLGLARNGRHHSAFCIYAAATLALYVVWPWRDGLRFLIPLVPFYLYFSWVGLDAVLRTLLRPAPRAKTFLAAAMVACMLAGFVRQTARHAAGSEARRQLAETGPFNPRALALYEFIRTQTPADAEIVFFKPRLLGHLTGRRSVMLQNADELRPGHLLCLNHVGDPTGRVAPEDLALLPLFQSATLLFANEQFELHALSVEAGSFHE